MGSAWRWLSGPIPRGGGAGRALSAARFQGLGLVPAVSPQRRGAGPGGVPAMDRIRRQCL